MSNSDGKTSATTPIPLRLLAGEQVAQSDAEKDQPGNIEHGTAIAISGEDDSDLEMTPEETRRLKKIIDWKVIPYCTLLYLLSESCLVTTCLMLVMAGGLILGFLDRVCLVLSSSLLIAQPILGLANWKSPI